jgi:flagellar biosynthesis/type III secretory pathway protein FliH
VKSLSPDPKLSPIVLDARPAGVRVVEGTRTALIARRAHEVEEAAFARGRAQGRESALAGAAGALLRASESLESARQQGAADIARDAARLGIEIARTLLRCEIDAGRYDIERIVRETLHASGAGRGACVVHLNPVDVARLEGVVFRVGTKLEADPEVPPGDVHITTARGLLVRDVEQALASIAERIEGDLG